LSDETIRTAHLGFHACERYEDRQAWGLQPKTDDEGREQRVWLPHGVVIPWYVGGQLWRVKIRRAQGDPKYAQPAGGTNALYNADALTPIRPAVIVEGEIDTLTVNQCAGDLVTAVATGSTGGARELRWIARLAACPLVLVAYDVDTDGQGDKAARFWVETLPNARRWRPEKHDANDMLQSGFDVRAWVAAGVDHYTPAAKPEEKPRVCNMLDGEAWREAFEERAAILESESGLPREEAEAIAERELRELYGPPEQDGMTR